MNQDELLAENSSEKRRPKRPKTPHDVAVAYAQNSWGKYGSRDAWEDSLRYKGVFTMADNSHLQSTAADGKLPLA